MIFFARRNFLLDNMAVKKNACHEIAASLKKDVGSCWEDSGNCWDGKTARLDLSTKTHAGRRGL